MRAGAIGATLVLSVAALAGCFGSSNGDADVGGALRATDTVPASAGVSAQAFIAYVDGLAANGNPEPALVPDFVSSTSDTKAKREPAPVN